MSRWTSPCVLCWGNSAMRPIVKEVLEAEARVDAIVQEARRKGSEIRRSAEKQMSETIGHAREQARQIIQDAVVEAEGQADRIRAERLEQADRQGAALLGGETKKIGDLVDRICDIILTTESETDNR